MVDEIRAVFYMLLLIERKQKKSANRHKGGKFNRKVTISTPILQVTKEFFFQLPTLVVQAKENSKAQAKSNDVMLLTN